MDFTYGSAFSVDSPDAYETLILDALLGDASLFTRADEVEEAWGIVTPIIEAWAGEARAGLPELRGRQRGGPTLRTRSLPGTDAGGGGSERRNGLEVGAGRPAVIPFEVPATPGAPTLRWSAHATSVAEIERELGRIWSLPQARRRGATERPGDMIAARTSVLNLVVVARTPELGEQAAATLTTADRPPPVANADPGADRSRRAGLARRADVKAYCMLPRADAPETCAERSTSRPAARPAVTSQAIVAPLLVHDLPVTVWWPGEPPFGTELHAIAGRDGRPAGRRRLALERRRPRSASGQLAALARPSLADLGLRPDAPGALARGGRLDLRSRRSSSPTSRRSAGSLSRTPRAAGPGAEGATNLVKPIYHVAWLASRLDLRVAKPLRPQRAPGGGRAPPPPAPGAPPEPGRGLRAVLERGRGADVDVVVRPVISGMPGGTTLRLELRAERRGSEVRAEVTAETESVHVRAWKDGVETLDRTFHAARRTDADLLAEAIEAGGRDPVAEGTLAMAAGLAGPGDPAGAS